MKYYTVCKCMILALCHSNICSSFYAGQPALEGWAIAVILLVLLCLILLCFLGLFCLLFFIVRKPKKGEYQVEKKGVCMCTCACVHRVYA